MPGYRVHDASTLMAALVAGGVYGAITRSAGDAAVLGGCTFLSGILLSPDLDIFVNPSWKYVLFPYGRLFARAGKMVSGARRVRAFGAVTASKAMQRWGPLRLIWVPYQLALFAWWLLFTKKKHDSNLGHRSVWSHTPVVGDVLRLVYLAAVASLVGGIALSVVHRGSPTLVWLTMRGFVMGHQHMALLALMGCSVATAVHCVLDASIPD